MMTDPIADLLTRIRNANAIYRKTVDIPCSKLKENILKVLQEEGYIQNYQILDDSVQKTLRVTLKYGEDNVYVINHIKRVSTPGRRVYQNIKEMKPILNGLGIQVISTPKGVLSSRKARTLKVGGEVICEVW
ncbi:MAG: 30S ribosomal protein S8 [Planctomycetota bacterium]